MRATRTASQGRSARSAPARVTWLLLVVLALTACGPATYGLSAHQADAAIQEARAEGAEESATYEYTFATALLEQAQVEASTASYSDADRYATLALAYAKRAVARARELKEAREARKRVQARKASHDG